MSHHLSPVLINIRCKSQGFPEEEGNGEGWRKPRVTLRHVEGSPSHSGTLKEAGVAEADAVIVGSAYSKDGKEVGGFSVC